MDKSVDFAKARISAFMDDDLGLDGGDSAATALDVMLRNVAEDPVARETWLRYHQIGDLLRSSELAPQPREQAFLKQFSERLSREPVQLAPDAIGVATQERQRSSRRKVWGAVGGVAASVTAVVVVTFSAIPSQQPAQNMAPAFVQTSENVSAAISQPRSADRNAGNALAGAAVPVKLGNQRVGAWAQYIMAHQQFAGSVLPYTPADIQEADFHVAASR